MIFKKLVNNIFRTIKGIINGKRDYGLIDFCDMLCAKTIGVKRNFFVKVLEQRCTVEEAGKIIMPILCKDEGDPEKSIELFYSKLTIKEKTKLKIIL